MLNRKLLVGLLAAAVVALLPGCGCGWCDIDGFSCDRLLITVHDGVTPDQVDAMNAEFGATVVDSSDPFYLLQMPEDCDVCDGMDFYEDRPEVNSALPDSEVSYR